MENRKTMKSEEHVSLEIPSLNDKHQLTDPSAKIPQETEIAVLESAFDKFEPPSQQKVHSVSISIPPSPIKVILFNPESNFNNGILDSSSAATSSSKLPEAAQFHSQALPKRSAFEDQAIQTGDFPYQPSIERSKDKRFDNFKTWSGKLERQISLVSLLKGKSPRKSDQPENAFVQTTDQVDPLPADRYFDALEGPELDTLWEEHKLPSFLVPVNMSQLAYIKRD